MIDKIMLIQIFSLWDLYISGEITGDLKGVNDQMKLNVMERILQIRLLHQVKYQIGENMSHQNLQVNISMVRIV